MNLKKVFFINTIIFFLIILLLELTARLLNLSDLVGVDSKLVITSEKNFHSLKPNSQGLVFNKKTFIDKYGFRVPRLDYNYKNKRKIFVIGDSVSFGNGVKEEDSFVGLLRSNLNRYELYNSSVFGYQAYHHENRIDEINKFLPVHKICSFSSFHVVTHLRFLNKLPEYVLVIQLVQDRASRLCSRSCILGTACSTLYSVVVLLCGEEKI